MLPTLWTQADAFAPAPCRLRDGKEKAPPPQEAPSVFEGELLELLGGVDTLRPRRIGPQGMCLLDSILAEAIRLIRPLSGGSARCFTVPGDFGGRPRGSPYEGRGRRGGRS